MSIPEKNLTRISLPSFQRHKESEFEKFKRAVENHLTQEVKYHDLILTPAEWEQLFLLQNSANSPVTPESRGLNREDASLHFEVKRALTRCYSLVLRLRGDKVAYNEFIQAQAEEKSDEAALPLSWEDFQRLSDKVGNWQQDDPDLLIVARATAFLSISTKIKERLNQHFKQLKRLPQDSEEFLSALSEWVQKEPDILPITQNFSAEQLNLLVKAYWFRMHFRHMQYTEGGDNMTESFERAVREGVFTQRDFEIWKERWEVNLFGFQGGPGAKYYNAEAHQLAVSVFKRLEAIFTRPEEPLNFLDGYLADRAQMAGFDDVSLDLDETETEFLAHMAAMLHRINIVTPERGAGICEGYHAFKKEYAENGELAQAYRSYRRDPKLVTSTYVPAVYNNAYLYFKNKKALSQQISLKLATHFMCQFLQFLYQIPHDQRMSCSAVAQEPRMADILSRWEENHAFIEWKAVTPGLGIDWEATETNRQFFTIALVPSAEVTRVQLRDCSLSLKEGSDYVLSEQSHGHITLVHASVDRGFNLDLLWGEVFGLLSKMNLQSGLPLSLKGTQAKDEGEWVWLQFQVKFDKNDEDPLYRLHVELCQLLQKYDVRFHNGVFEHYAPHCTLSHTSNKSLVEELAKQSVIQDDNWVVVLGFSGTAWQMRGVRYSSNLDLIRVDLDVEQVGKNSRCTV